MTRTVLAIPTTETTVEPAIYVGTADTIEDALALVRRAGYLVIEEGDGGLYETYDAGDSARIYECTTDGLATFGITVRA